jgi:predicted nucleic acid-binding protein
MSRIVWTEVLAGEPLHQRPRLQHLMSPLEVVEVDARIAAAAADVRHRSRMKLLDALILATAQVNGAILITRNTKDFPASMPGIRVPYTL